MGTKTDTCDGARWRSTRTALGLLSLAVATVLMTWPVVATLDTRFAGHWADLQVTQWDMKWVERVVFEGRQLLYTTDIFYPKGVSLSFHSISWLSGLWALPLRRLFGPVTGYNLFFLTQTWLCGVTMFLLVRRVSGRYDSALLAGLVFAFGPFRMLEACSHPNLAGTCFVPLSMLGFWNGVRDGRKRWAWLVGVSMALTLLTGVHLFFMASIALASYWLFDGLLARRYRQPWFWWWSANVVGAIVVCCALPATQFLLHIDALPVAAHSHFGNGRSTDLLGLLIPPLRHPLLGSVGRRMVAAFGSPTSYSVYLGFLPFALSLLAIAVPGALRRPLIPVALTTALLLSLSMGDELVIAKRAMGVPLPLSLVSGFAPIQALRHPDRFMLIASAFFAVLAGCGVSTLLRTRRMSLWLAVPLCLAVLGEYRTGHYRTEKLEPAPIYAQLPADHLALLELPLNRVHSKRNMFQQTYHGRPIVNGMVARSGERKSSYIAASPLLRRFAGRRLSRHRCRDFDLQRAWHTLSADGVGYVIVNRARVRGYWRELSSYFAGKPSLQTKSYLVYRTVDLARVASSCP